MKSGGNHTLLLLITMIVTLLPIVFGVCVWSKLPQTIAIHFGLDGQANGWAPRWVMVFLIPVAMAVVQLIVYFAMQFAVSRGAIAPAIYNISMLIVPVCAVICAVAIYAKALR